MVQLRALAQILVLSVLLLGASAEGCWRRALGPLLRGSVEISHIFGSLCASRGAQSTGDPGRRCGEVRMQLWANPGSG